MTDSPAPPRADSGRANPWLIVAALLIVAAGITMYFVTRPAPPAETRTAAGIRSLAGEGLLEGPEARFTWSRDPRADVYRLETYDLTSRLLAAAVLRDTSILASAVLPESSHAGVWRVVPVSRGGTELPPTPNQRFLRP